MIEQRWFIIVEDWQGAEIFSEPWGEDFVYWPYPGTA
jgi:hypothetical protein